MVSVSPDVDGEGTPIAKIEPGAAAPTHPTVIPLTGLNPDSDDERAIRIDLDVFHDSPVDPEQPSPYPSLAHAATALSHGS